MDIDRTNCPPQDNADELQEQESAEKIGFSEFNAKSGSNNENVAGENSLDCACDKPQIDGAVGKGKGGNCKKRQNYKNLSIVLGACMLVFTFFAGFFTNKFTQEKTARTVSEIVRIIDKTAVDYAESGKAADSDAAVRALVRQLLWYDEYAAYYSREQYNEVQAQSHGNYSGYGISLLQSDEKVYLYSVVGNSPADRAGMRRGDVLTGGKRKADDNFTVFSGIDDANAFFKDLSADEEITISIARGGESYQYDVKREGYVAAYVEYHDGEGSYLFRDENGGTPKGVWTDESEFSHLFTDRADTGYVIFSSFEGNAAAQLREVLDLMGKRGKTKLILDLRYNGGGDLNVMEQIIALMINGGNRYPYMYVQEKTRTTEYRLKDGYTHSLNGVTVLANYETASASECLMGAMLCYGDLVCSGGFSIADVVIEHNPVREDYSTYGKGIMQTTYPLSTGGALKLTTARILWPNNKTCVQGTGVAQTDLDNCKNGNDAILRAAEILGAK